METAGFSDFSYGTNTRLLNQAINRLRECGSEAILGEMPKIAVIGNQSAGKSSLIEAMSGVSSLPILQLILDSSSTTRWNVHTVSHGSGLVADSNRFLEMSNFSSHDVRW